MSAKRPKPKRGGKAKKQGYARCNQPWRGRPGRPAREEFEKAAAVERSFTDLMWRRAKSTRMQADAADFTAHLMLLKESMVGTSSSLVSARVHAEMMEATYESLFSKTKESDQGRAVADDWETPT